MPEDAPDYESCPEYVQPSVGPGCLQCGRPGVMTVLATSGQWEPRCQQHGEPYPDDRRRCACGTSTVGAYHDGGKHRADVCGWGVAAHSTVGGAP